MTELLNFTYIHSSQDNSSESKKLLLQFMSKSVLPMFFSMGFIASGLTFKALIHFEFISVYGIREAFHVAQ